MHIQMQVDFHSRNMRHNDTYLQNPKGHLNKIKIKKKFQSQTSVHEWFPSRENLNFVEFKDMTCIQSTEFAFLPWVCSM